MNCYSLILIILINSLQLLKMLKTIQNLHAQGYTLGLVSNGKTPFQEHNFML